MHIPDERHQDSATVGMTLPGQTARNSAIIGMTKFRVIVPSVTAFSGTERRHETSCKTIARSSAS